MAHLSCQRLCKGIGLQSEALDAQLQGSARAGGRLLGHSKADLVLRFTLLASLSSAAVLDRSGKKVWVQARPRDGYPVCRYHIAC